MPVGDGDDAVQDAASFEEVHGLGLRKSSHVRRGDGASKAACEVAGAICGCELQQEVQEVRCEVIRCKVCKRELSFEQIAGMRLYRDVGGVHVFRARCACDSTMPRDVTSRGIPVAKGGAK